MFCLAGIMLQVSAVMSFRNYQMQNNLNLPRKPLLKGFVHESKYVWIRGFATHSICSLSNNISSSLLFSYNTLIFMYSNYYYIFTWSTLLLYLFRKLRFDGNASVQQIFFLSIHGNILDEVSRVLPKDYATRKLSLNRNFLWTFQPGQSARLLAC